MAGLDPLVMTIGHQYAPFRSRFGQTRSHLESLSLSAQLKVERLPPPPLSVPRRKLVNVFKLLSAGRRGVTRKSDCGAGLALFLVLLQHPGSARHKKVSCDDVTLRLRARDRRHVPTFRTISLFQVLLSSPFCPRCLIPFQKRI